MERLGLDGAIGCEAQGTSVDADYAWNNWKAVNGIAHAMSLANTSGGASGRLRVIEGARAVLAAGETAGIQNKAESRARCQAPALTLEWLYWLAFAGRVRAAFRRNVVFLDICSTKRGVFGQVSHHTSLM
ncbi:hypothetical protein HFK84_15245 [Ralstonia pseudosolanacearum]|uniref:hypothetical protein n=1 Tax=Ralstonia pseudosolanacearum TaxID=1310165 RepID=UPI002004622B|nr:hypothetical protein [Ralstonia pseudosolanacearum]MCK4143625.1 hypothetical protein [Ralstonia pseudosolanacearum]